LTLQEGKLAILIQLSTRPEVPFMGS